MRKKLVYLVLSVLGVLMWVSQSQTPVHADPTYVNNILDITSPSQLIFGEGEFGKFDMQLNNTSGTSYQFSDFTNIGLMVDGEDYGAVPGFNETGTKLSQFQFEGDPTNSDTIAGRVNLLIRYGMSGKLNQQNYIQIYLSSGDPSNPDGTILVSNKINFIVNPPEPTVNTINPGDTTVTGGLSTSDFNEGVTIHLTDANGHTATTPFNTKTKSYTFDAATLAAANVSFNGGDKVTLWATNGTGGTSNKITTTVFLNITTQLITSTIMYYNQYSGGGNARLFKNFTNGQIGGVQLDGGDGLQSFSAKLTSGATTFPTVTSTSANKYLGMYVSDNDGKYFQIAKSQFFPTWDYWQAHISDASGKDFLQGGTSPFVMVNTQYFSGVNVNALTPDKIDPQKTHTYKLGQNLLVNSSDTTNVVDGYQLTNNSFPFILIAPKPTISNKLYETDDTIYGSRTIKGTNAIISDVTKQPTPQPGDKVYVFRDQTKGSNSAGEYDMDDQTYDADPANSLATAAIVQNDGTFQIDIPTDVKLTPGEVLWVTETNGSGGTSAVYKEDETTFDSVSTGGAKVVVQPAAQFNIDGTNWDFGKQKYFWNTGGDYFAQNNPKNTIDFTNVLSKWQLQVSITTPLTDTTTGSTVNSSLSLSNLKLTTSDSSKTYTDTVASSANITSSPSNLASITNTDNNTSWKLGIGSNASDGSNSSIKLNVDPNQSMKYGNTYQSTLTWSILDSVA